MDKRSEISGLSRATSSVVAPPVLIPCSGDFCDYDEGEEIIDMKSDPEFNTKAELRKARNRYKRIWGQGEVHKDLKLQEDEEEDEGEIDQRASKHTNNENDDSSWMIDDAESMTGGRFKNRHTRKGDLHIPMKSIAMARDEIRNFDRLDEGEKKNILAAAPMTEADLVSEQVQTHILLRWPAPLLHWWWRMNKSKGHSTRVPATSGFTLGINKILERHDRDGAFNGKENENKYTNIKKQDQVVSKKSNIRSDLEERREVLEAMLEGDDKKANKIEYDLSDNPYNTHGRKHIGQNVGQITTFYHDARVCEKCYHLYRELDYLRDRDRKLRLRLKRKVKKEEIDPNVQRMKDKQIEKRIFEQRKFVSRLSKLKPIKAEKPHNAHMFLDGGMSSAHSHMNNGGSSSKFQESMISDVSFNENMSMFNGSVASFGAQNKPRKGAPKGALPPLPWQLDQYEQHNQGTSFVRNIGQKAYESTIASKHGKILEQERIKQERKSKGLESIDLEMSDKFVDDTQSEWNAFVNQHRSMSSGTVGSGYGLPPIQEQTQKYYNKVNGKKTLKKKNFDTQRLMHPWQRYMNNLRTHGQETADAIHEEEKQRQLEREREHQQQHAPLNKHLGIKNKTVKQPAVITNNPSIHSSVRKNVNDNSVDHSSLMELQKIRKAALKDKSNVKQRPQVEQQPQSTDYDDSSIVRFDSSKVASPSKKAITSLDGQRVGSLKMTNRIQVKSTFAKKESENPSSSPQKYQDDEGDSDSDDDGAIGWSPFVIPTM